MVDRIASFNWDYESFYSYFEILSDDLKPKVRRLIPTSTQKIKMLEARIKELEANK